MRGKAVHLTSLPLAHPLLPQPERDGGWIETMKGGGRPRKGKTQRMDTERKKPGMLNREREGAKHNHDS
jgi:hypothetical protein